MIKMEVITNATPLIYLTKCNLISLLEKLDVKLITTPEVKNEVLIERFTEYVALKEFIEKNIRTEPIDIEKSFTNSQLGKGEASVLSLATKLKLPVISDDKLAHLYAHSYRIEIHYTTFFLYRAVKKKVVSKREALEYLDRMILNQWRCDIKTYVLIKRKIELL